MEIYVLDANLFFNMQAGIALGEKTQEVVFSLSQYAKRLKGRAVFYMPPRVVEEFLSFFEDKNDPVVKELLSSVVVKTPDYAKINFSSRVFLEFVEDVRRRNLAGLNIAEEVIQETGRKITGVGEKNKQAFQKEIGPFIKGFRERYRHATRFGFLDSGGDLDLIMLAKETEAFLVTTDEGVIRWGRVFGIKEMPVGAWRLRLEALLHHPE